MTSAPEPGRADGVRREWLSTSEAADYLGLTPGRVRAEFASGRLEGSRLGYRTLRFKREHLDDLMQSLTVPSRRPAPFAAPGIAGLIPHKRRGIGGHSL